MNTKPEDEFFDQELRNAFHNFSMPPAEHPDVWTGIQGRIAALPAAARPSLSHKLKFPLAAAVVGVVVGWLLPHPAPQPVPAPTPSAASEVRMQPVRNKALTATTVLIPTAAVALPPRQVLVVQTYQRPNIEAKPLINKAEATPYATAEIVSWPIAASDLGTAVPDADQLVAAPETLSAVSNQPAMVAQNEPTPAAALPAKALKQDGTSDRIVYHKPRSRQPESGTGIRRWITHLGQNLRHFVGL